MHNIFHERNINQFIYSLKNNKKMWLFKLFKISFLNTPKWKHVILSNYFNLGINKMISNIYKIIHRYHTRAYIYIWLFKHSIIKLWLMCFHKKNPGKCLIKTIVTVLEWKQDNKYIYFLKFSTLTQFTNEYMIYIFSL